MTKTPLASTALLLCWLSAGAQSITGVVSDAASGDRLDSVRVFLKGTQISVLTNAAGEYSIGPSSIQEGSRTLRRDGFFEHGRDAPILFTTDGRRVVRRAHRRGPNVDLHALSRGTYVVTDGVRTERVVTVGAAGRVPLSEETAATTAAAGKMLADGETLVFVKMGYITNQGTTPLGSTLDMALDAEPDDKPGIHNTGSSGTLSPYDGPGTITTDGDTYENFTLQGTITIDADSVTLRNFKIDGGHYCIRVNDGHSGITIEDGELYNMASAGILGVGFTARRLYIHDSNGDGLKVQGSGGPTVVEYCFIEKLGMGDGAHADGNQTRGGADITFRYNTIYMPNPGTPTYPGAPYKSNATFMLQLTISNFVIENNWLTGGNYCIYSPGGVSVRNNRFGRHNAGWIDDKDDLRIRNGTFDEWSGNVWEDDGTAVP
ncbi:MAG: hypothetical protein GF331_18315 [Chitinivibrionales bacterium]|nr:hypothetical protein [Chitinivibrionales bacterium]